MEDVEGDWNGLTFRIATAEMADQIQDLLISSYYPDEPLLAKIGNIEAFDKDFEKVWRPKLKDGLSLAVFDKETGRMVAARVSFEQRPTDPPLQDIQTEEFKKKLVLNSLLDAQSDVFNKYQVDRCSKSLLGTVHPDFRCRGILTEMYRRSINLCKALGYKVIRLNLSNPISRRGAAKVGFIPTASVDYHIMKNDDGSKFIEASEPGDLATQSLYIFND